MNHWRFILPPRPHNYAEYFINFIKTSDTVTSGNLAMFLRRGVALRMEQN